MNALNALEVIVKEAYARCDASVAYRHAFERGAGGAERRAYAAAEDAHAKAWASMQALTPAERRAALELAEAVLPRSTSAPDEWDEWLERAWKRALKDHATFLKVARARGALCRRAGGAL